ncbi:MAG TPA: hypothetical protein VI072_16265 [Polyangiaceae bacterium]
MAERLGAVSREIDTEQAERSARLARVKERIRGIVLMQLDGDRSPTLAEMRRDLKGGTIVCSPEGGTYVARAELLPLAVLLDTPSAENAAKLGSQAALSSDGCAGALCGLDNAIALEFERRLVA